MPSTATIKDIATIVGVTIAAASLLYTAFNARLTLKTTRARFWLDLRDRFHRFDALHVKLSTNGEWNGSKGGPQSREEWIPVEAYMGLFEHCELMLEDGLLDAKTFRKIYRYRVSLILNNPTIVRAKLIDHAADWDDFLKLARRFELRVPGT
jgi:hypothetical protein